ATPGPPKSSGAPGGLTAATDGAARKLSAARKRSSPARMGRHANAYDAILLGYGLCSNGIAGIEARRTPLVVVRGHDCITHLIGSRQRYREYFDAHPGTYWYSPGWIDTGSQPGQARYERTLQAYVDRYGADNAKYLMDMEQGWFKSYSFATYVDLGIGGGDAGKEYTRSCAQWLGWQYDELQGDPGLLTRFVNGDWESDDFLIVQPGQKIVPSYDERVIRAEDGHPAAPAE
ncbi:MAG: DUF1638 domain-containing protein, partial [Planctomycetota bacterium]